MEAVGLEERHHRMDGLRHCVGTVVATEAAAVEWGLEDAMDSCGLATGRELEA